MAKKEITPKDTNAANDILAEAQGNQPGESAEHASKQPEGAEEEPNKQAAKPTEIPEENEGTEKTAAVISIEDHEKDIRIKTANAYNEGYEAAKAETTDSVQEEKKNYLLKKYGPNPVAAEKGSIQTIFSRVAWDNLKTGKDGTKDGWREIVQVPPEVQALHQQRES